MDAFFTNSWNVYLDFFPKCRRDIYFEEEYVRLYETLTEKATCFVYREGNKCLLYPFLLRAFQYGGVDCFDFETAYGYGGPIANVEDKDFEERALQEFFRMCKANNYVAGFTRFHPLLKNWQHFDTIGKLIFDRHTIAVSVKNNLEEIWMCEIHTKNRNVIKKGEKSGLKFLVDDEFKHIDEFAMLYRKTMDKLHADEFYYFDEKYYRNFKTNIPNSFLGVVYLEEQMIAAAIFFYSELYGHYHLAGSDVHYLKYMPNNYLLWNACKELNRRNVCLFHLGGGTTSDENDSLYEFKSRFSKSRYDFYIGKLIFNEKMYNSLVTDWETNNPNKKDKYKYYLLKYKY